MKAKRSFLNILLVAVLAVPAVASAQNGRFAPESPSMSRKVRNLGMGNVGVAIRGSHDSSPFYNPAGLNDLEKGRFQFLTPTFEMAADSVTSITDTMTLIDDINATDDVVERTRILDAFIAERRGEYQRVRFALDLFNYARKNFAAGLAIDERMDMSFDESNPPGSFNIRNIGDVFVFLYGAQGFKEGLVQVGVTLRPTVRFSLDEENQNISYADVVGEDTPGGDPVIEEQMKQVYEDRRFGMGVDLGLKTNLALPFWKDAKVYKFLQPAFGVTWQDIGSPTFGAAPDNEQSVSIGAAVHPDVWILKNTFAFDIRDLNQGKDFITKLHIGAESMIDWAIKFGLRVGLNQGYFTGGATLDFRFVKLDLAYYMEEVGTFSRQKGSGRFATTLSFNI